MSEWQPIETAPNDGNTAIILAKFVDGDTYWIASGCLDSTDGEWWCDVSDMTVYFMDGAAYLKPSHWMPLPSPPKEPEPTPDAIPSKSEH